MHLFQVFTFLLATQPPTPNSIWGAAASDL
jgi:hypothetical protein